MSKLKNYILNPETLLYEIKEDKSHYLAKASAVVVASLLLLVALLLGYTYIPGFELPKTALLRYHNAEWTARLSLLNARLDRDEAVLDGLEMRDNGIYRSLFGMNEIPASVRTGGPGGTMAYEGLAGAPLQGALLKTALRLDRLSRRSYVQGRSFEDVAQMAALSGDMALCIPAIMPVRPDARKLRFTSTYGYRSDPFTHRARFHAGDDFACDIGNTVHATGGGVVESVRREFSGYGLSVLVDHGFGYKTRYAHLSRIDVAEGMKVRRGTQLGLSGNSGRSTGPHVHYEVMYKGDTVDPGNYFDLDIALEDYLELIRNASGGAQP